MEEGDLDFSYPDPFCDSIFDELLKNTEGCTHTHICNPPKSTDLPHTHTCYHIHHKIISSPANEDTVTSTDKTTPKKRVNGNRVAVKKYREKKKARAASLEEEVAHLRAVNQQLMKRLQGQAALEAEVMRLRCLLVDIRGRIDGEIGSFPYQKPNGRLNRSFLGGGGGNATGSCDDLRCLDDGLGNAQGCVPCEIGNVQCMGSSSNGSKEEFVCRGGNGMNAGCFGNVDVQ